MDTEDWAAVMAEHGGLDRYLECMSEKGSSHDKRSWGDGVIIEAAACLYGHPISVLSLDTPAKIHLSKKESSDAATVTLGIVDNNHYVSLMPRSQNTSSDIVVSGSVPVVCEPNCVAPSAVLDVNDTDRCDFRTCITYLLRLTRKVA